MLVNKTTNKQNIAVTDIDHNDARTRTITSLTDSGIVFGSGYTASGVSNNSVGIPLSVIGCKIELPLV